LTYLLSLRAQRLISGPILDLAEVTRRIKERKDYLVRAKKWSNDEVGFLVDSFNEMLDQLEQREKHLAHIHDELRKSEEQFRTGFEASPTGYAQVNPQTYR